MRKLKKRNKKLVIGDDEKENKLFGSKWRGASTRKCREFVRSKIDGTKEFIEIAFSIAFL